MKAIVTLKRGKSSASLSAYCVEPKADLAKQADVDFVPGERLLDAYSFGCESDPLNSESVASELSARVKYLPRQGKEVFHFVFSFLPENDSERDPVYLEKVKAEVMGDFMAAYGNGSKAVGYSHGDGGKPHSHLLMEAFDPSKYKRHRYQKNDLSVMNDFAWTKAVEKGKGHRAKSTDRAKSPRARVIEEKRVSRAKQDMEMVAVLAKHFGRDCQGKSVGDLAELLVKRGLPAGFTAKLKTTAGRMRKEPSVSGMGTTVRLGRFSKLLDLALKNMAKKPAPYKGERKSDFEI